MATVNEVIRDRLIKRSVYLERFKTSQYNKVLPFLERLERQLAGEIGPGVKLKDIAEKVDKALDSIQGELFPELERYAGSELNKTAGMIKESIPVDVTFKLPTPATLWATVMKKPFQGALMKDHLGQFSENMKRKVWGIIQDGITLGKPYPEIVRDLKGQGATGDIFATARHTLETIVRTSVSHVMSETRRTVYRENDDIIKAEKWVSTLDTSTTPICMMMDGATREIGESQWSNGEYGEPGEIHWNCRSVAVPVVVSWRELGLDLDELSPGERASMNGQVPAETTYPEWLKGQPAQVQDDILGKTRGEAFRDGNLSLDRFIKDGKFITIEQLDKIT